MRADPIDVLLVEDDPLLVGALRDSLRQATSTEGSQQFRLAHADRLADALTKLRTTPVDVVLLDLALPDARGLEAVARLRTHAPSAPVVVLAGPEDEVLALKAVRDGAEDYLLKGQIHPTLLARALRYALQRRRGAERLRRTESLLAESQRLTKLGSWEWDLVADTMTWTDELYRLCGLPIGTEMTFARVLELVHPDDRGRMRSEIDRVRETGGAFDLLARLVRPDGTMWIAHDVGRVIVDESDRPTRMIGTARDVTASHAAELALRESEERYRGLVELAPDGIVVHRAGKIVFANDAAARLFGAATPDALIDRAVVDLVHPDFRPAVAERIGQARPMGTKMPISEERLLQLDGTAFDAEITSIVVAYRGDRATQAVIRDVSERRRAEAKIRRQALVFETIGDAVMVTDPDAVIIDWNPAAERIFGYSRAEMIGRRPIVFHHPDVGSGLHETIAAALAREGRWAGEVKFLRKDGAEGFADVVVVVQHDASGKPIAHIGVNRDITERRRAEMALRESEERLACIVETSAGGIVIVDRSGRVTFANPAAERILGLERDDAAGRMYDDPRWKITAVDGRPFPEADLPFVRVMATGRPVHDVEHAIAREDGRRTILSVSAAPLRGPDGEVTGVVGSLHDVTERYRVLEALRQSEAQLRQAQKMEAVGRLAGGVAHDFNNLLTAILGFSDMLLADLGTADSRREDVMEIRKAGERATALTRQLLAFSRRQVLQPRVLDVNSLVGDLERMLRRLIGEDIELVTDLAPELWAVMADPGQLEQVLMNLVVNARDAMPGGGVITIETSNKAVDETYVREHPIVEAGDFVMLTVSDTGIGMDEATQSRVFEPFFTTKRAGEGTGLGLAMAYGIVKQSGGFIEVSSEVGRGTTFTILLPVAAQSAPGAGRARDRDATPGGCETVLLVEDEEAVRYLARRALERAGYRVIDARHGQDALALCADGDTPVHLLVTDVVMPQMGGRDLAERLATLQPSARVLYMSGYTDDEIIRRGMIDRQTAFLQKPFTAAQLLHRVRKVLDDASRVGESNRDDTRGAPRE